MTTCLREVPRSMRIAFGIGWLVLTAWVWFAGVPATGEPLERNPCPVYGANYQLGAVNAAQQCN